MIRYMKCAAAAVALMLAGLAGPAVALEHHEASAVVSILERLAPERGETVFPNAAEDWFEYDSEQEGLIEAAGYDSEEWQEIYEDTISAYLATIPDDEYAAFFDGVEERLAASDLSAEQKAQLLEQWRSDVAELDQRRRQAKPMAVVVKPLAPRLSALMAMN